ncbi:MAG: molybdate ABC transporter substrate-binding protein [Candidatus Zipacnadales bacterium]
MRTIALIAALSPLSTLLACRSDRIVERRPLIVRGSPLLQEIFPALVADFETAYPDIDVRTDFSCPPCALATRIQDNLVIDVFISAGDVELKWLGKSGLLDLATTVPIGSVHLVLIVPSENPANITAFGDIHRLQVKRIAMGHPDSTSLGHYVRQALENMGLWSEVEHKLLFTKTGCEAYRAVVMDQAEAGFVYNFCVAQGAGRPQIIEHIPERLHDPIVLSLTIGTGRDGPAVEAFVKYMQSPNVQAILRDYDIGPPSLPREEPA